MCSIRDKIISYRILIVDLEEGAALSQHGCCCCCKAASSLSRAQGLHPSILIIVVIGETLFRSQTLRLLQRGKVVFLWGAILMVFGIGMWQVY
jgi:hypothetical protein